MPESSLTDLQQKAVQLTSNMSRAFNHNPQIGVLRGVAGAGKTTTIKAIIKEIGSSVIITPTGKAAQRVQELTGMQSQTIHRWLYSGVVHPQTGEVSFSRKSLEDMETSESGVLILDEGSMIGQDLWEDIHTACSELGLNILIVGDHAQLPPVNNEDSEFSLVSPMFNSHWSVTLDKVHRQALDSPIIAAATEIRTADVYSGLISLPRIMKKNLVQTCLDVLEKGGVILCHRNATRHSLNKALRTAKWQTGLDDIKANEPLLVLKNQYSLNRYNGEVFNFRGWEDKMNTESAVWDIAHKVRGTTDFGFTNVGENGVAIMATLATAAVNGYIDGFQASQIEKVAKKIYSHAPYLHCNYGYALSVHKSQGSQWPEVLVIVEESVRLGMAEGRSWAYTAVTRAEQKCSICFLSDEALASLGA